jgi:hypothetical protein
VPQTCDERIVPREMRQDEEVKTNILKNKRNKKRIGNQNI